MSLWIYRILFIPALLVLAPSVWLRMRRRGGHREDFAHRLGRLPMLPPKQPGRRRVWLQAVSVGEVLAVEPIVHALERVPDVEVFLSTTTSTGLAVARQHYAHRVTAMGYFPIDWFPFVRRAWRCVEPDLVLLTEGERWPEFIARAERNGVPLVVVNARISDRSFSRMMRFRSAVKRLLRGVTQLLAVSDEDAARFRSLGFSREQVTVTGNLKLDVTIPDLPDADRRRLREELGLGQEDLVLLGSSTWPGEEIALVNAWRRARDSGIACRLLIVPRHAERRDEIEAELRQAGVRHHFRTRGPAPGDVDVSVADTTGELRNLTQLADLVFIGKSLSPHHEGQTPVEAAALGRAMLFGTRMTNFRAIANDLVAAGGARRVDTPESLAGAVCSLLPDAPTRARMGECARKWQQKNQGAIARVWEQIHVQLTHR